MIAYKLVCFMLFSTCLIHSSDSSVYGGASWVSFALVELVCRWFHVAVFLFTCLTLTLVRFCSSKPYTMYILKLISSHFRCCTCWHGRRQNIFQGTANQCLLGVSTGVARNIYRGDKTIFTENKIFDYFWRGKIANEKFCDYFDVLDEI